VVRLHFCNLYEIRRISLHIFVKSLCSSLRGCTFRQYFVSLAEHDGTDGVILSVHIDGQKVAARMSKTDNLPSGRPDTCFCYSGVIRRHFLNKIAIVRTFS